MGLHIILYMKLISDDGGENLINMENGKQFSCLLMSMLDAKEDGNLDACSGQEIPVRCSAKCPGRMIFSLSVFAPSNKIYNRGSAMLDFPKSTGFGR